LAGASTGMLYVKRLQQAIGTAGLRNFLCAAFAPRPEARVTLLARTHEPGRTTTM
jgi:hypothetical protein